MDVTACYVEFHYRRVLQNACKQIIIQL